MISSCTIEKRVTRKGYHVEWSHKKRTFKKPSTDQKKTNLKVKVQSVKRNKHAIQQKGQKTSSNSILFTPITKQLSCTKTCEDKFVNTQALASKPVTVSQRLFRKETKSKGNIPESSNLKRELEPHGMFAFIIGLLILVFIIMGFPLIFLWYISVLLISMISIRNFNQNPDKYSGKGFALIAFSMGIVGTMFISLFLLWLTVFFIIPGIILSI